MPLPRRAPATASVLASVALAMAAGLTACSDAPAAEESTPADRLAESKAVLDETPSVTVELTGEDLPTAGTVLVSGSGVAAHPASFEGELRISQAGLAVTVPLVSIDGTVWAQLPLTPSYTVVDPGSFGVGDPGQLIDSQDGVSALLTADPDPVDLGDTRLGGDVLEEYEAQLPGELVGALLTIADPSATVTARFALDPATAELRRAVLTGPFYEGGAEQTYTLLLDGYGADADIRAPTG
ncbi:MAG TPA: LppX_LprAFG lipoprotein [Jiangellales bacterium]|nr:LppX_LprAFG lipoprotein [Jiangellales bacterium]